MRETYRNLGFTLIELMVVISIISLLSSVILVSVSSARLKARDSTLISQADEMRKLFELEYYDNKSYINFQRGGWMHSAADCNSNFSGNYQAQARAICINIINTSSGDEPWGYGDIRYYVGNSIDTDKYYSIIIYLPGKKKFYCLGSSGVGSDSTDPSNFWNQPGCFSNP